MAGKIYENKSIAEFAKSLGQDVDLSSYKTPVSAGAEAKIIPNKVGAEAFKQATSDPKADFALLDQEQRNYLTKNAILDGKGNYILKSYPQDARNWDKISGAVIPKEYADNMPKYGGYTSKVSQGELTSLSGLDDADQKTKLLQQMKDAPNLIEWGKSKLELDKVEYRMDRKNDGSYYADQYKKAFDAQKTIQRELDRKDVEKEWGISFLQKATAKVGTGKLTDITGEDYTNPFFYGAKFIDIHVSVAKALTQATIDAVGGIAGSVELNSSMFPEIQKTASYVSDLVKNVKTLTSPYLNRATNVGGWEDPEFYATGIASFVPHLAGATLSAMGGALIGSIATANPVGATIGAGVGGVSYGYTMESGSMYNELLDRGLPLEQSRKFSQIYGLISAPLEALGGVGHTIGKFTTQPLMTRLFKNALKAEVKETFIKGTITNSGKFFANFAGEGLTEGAQQFTQNVLTNVLDKSQGIWDGVAESVIFGGITGGGMGIIADTSYNNQNKNNKQNDINKTQEQVNEDTTTPTDKTQEVVVNENPVKKQIAEASIDKRALEGVMKAGEVYIKSYPESEEIKATVEEARASLKKIDLKLAVLSESFIQTNSKSVVQNDVIDFKVGRNVNGEYVSSADIKLGSTSSSFSSDISYATEQEAQLSMAEKVQTWLGDQVMNNKIEDLNQAKVLNSSIAKITSQPKVTEMLQSNRDVMMLARDTENMSDFETKVFDKKLLPKGTDLTTFYTQARSSSADYITSKEAERIVADLAGDIGVSTKVIDRLITPQGKKAFGSFLRDSRVVNIVTQGGRDVELTTPYHEVGHAYFQTLLNDKERTDILDEVKKNHVGQEELNDSQAEEKLVEDLRAYNDKKLLKDLKKRISSPYAKMLDGIKAFVDKIKKWMGKGGVEDKISKFYDDVLSLKRPSEVKGYKDNESYRIVEKMPMEVKDISINGEGRVFNYVRSTKKSPDMESEFGQDIEPAGRYMNLVTERGLLDVENKKSMEVGMIEFKNPLFIREGDTVQWKKNLSEKYNAVGITLSKAILKDGYDAIITIADSRSGGKSYVSEVVDLSPIGELTMLAKDLIVVHNTTFEKLKKSVGLGGLPSPSIAITKQGTEFSGYGEITFLGSSEMIDPIKNKDNKIFDADAYSPRVPDEQYVIDRKKAEAIYSSVFHTVPKDLQERSNEIYDSLMNKKNATPESLASHSYDSPGMLYQFLKSKKIDPEIQYKDKVPKQGSIERFVFDKKFSDFSFDFSDTVKGTEFYKKISPLIKDWIALQDKDIQGEYNNFYYAENGDLNFRMVDSLMSDVKRALRTPSSYDHYDTMKALQKQVADRTEFDAWVNDKFSEVLGDKYFFKGTKKIPYTLSNIVDQMSGHIKNKESNMFSSSYGGTRASMAKEYKSIELLQNDRSRINSSKETTDLYKKIEEDFSNLGSTIPSEGESYFDTMDNISSAFKKYSKKAKTLKNMESALVSNGLEVTREDVATAKDVADRMMTIPVSYMEAKPQRAVFFHEFEAIVVPEDQYADVSTLLSHTELKDKIYTYTGESQRTELIKNLSDSTGVSFRTQQDPLYEEALKYDTVEEFVEAQTNAYHGTSKAFDEFDASKRTIQQGESSKAGFYFNKDPKEAQVFAREAAHTLKTGTNGEVMPVKLEYQNPKFLAEGKTTAKIDIVLQAKTEGYDAVIDDSGNIVVFDTSKIYTKQQLIDIYNKAHSNESFRTDNFSLDDEASNPFDEDYEAPELTEKQSKSFEEAQLEVFTELEIAEAGSRMSVADGDTGTMNIASSSTFPKWLRPENRSRKLIDRAMEIADSKLTLPPARSVRIRSTVMDIYAEINRRSNFIEKEKLEKLFDKKDRKKKKEKAVRLTYNMFPVAITPQDLAMVESISRNADMFSDVYDEKTAKSTLAFLKDAYKSERELLSRTGSPFPAEVASRLSAVEEYAQAGLTDAITSATKRLIPSSTASTQVLYSLVPESIRQESTTFDEMIARLLETDSELATALQEKEGASTQFNDYKNVATIKDVKTFESLQKRLDKVRSKDVATNTAIVNKLVKQRVDMIELNEKKALRDTNRNSKRNIARMINVGDGKRVKVLEKTIQMTDKQYVKNIIKAQIKSADASSIETKRILNEKVREKNKWKKLVTSFENLRKKIKSASKTGNQYHVDSAREILSIFDTYDLSSMSEQTVLKLQDIYEKKYNNEQVSDAMKEWYDKTVPRLSKTSIRDMSFEDLQQLYDTLSILAESSAYELYMIKYLEEEEKAKRVDLAIKSTINLDIQKEKGRRRDTVASLSLNKVLGIFTHINLEMLSPVAVADRFDGDMNYTGVNATFVKTLQRGEQAYYKDYHGAIDELRIRVTDIKESFTEEEETYLTLLARIREDADNAVDNLMEYMGVDTVPEQVGDLTIDEADHILDIIEEIYEKYNVTNRLAAIFERKNNKPFTKLAHYIAPLKYTDYTKDLTEDPEMEVLSMYDNRSANVGEGNANKRKDGVMLTPRTDLFNMISEGLGHSFYYIHMQPTIDNIHQVVTDKNFTSHAGSTVSKWWRDYLTIVAQKGRGKADSPLDGLIRKGRQNFQVGILGFKLGTVLIQPTAGVNAALMANSMHGAEAGARIMAELARFYVVPSIKNETISKSDALLMRAGSGGSIDMYDINNQFNTGFKNTTTMYGKLKTAYVKGSMAMIQEVDIRTAGAVWKGIYDTLISRGVSETKATQEADFFMTLSQSSTQIVDRPMILSRWGEVGRLAFTFQTFTLGLWSMVSQGIIRNGIIKGDSMTKIKSVLALVGIPLFQSFAGELVRIVNLWLKGKDDDEDMEDKLKNIFANAPLELVAQLPFIGSIIKGKLQYNADYQVPGVSNAIDLIEGAELIITAKDYDELVKGLLKTGEAGGIVVGVPGTAQAFDLIERFKQTVKQKKDNKISVATKKYIAVGETTKGLKTTVDDMILELYTTEEIKAMKPITRTNLEKSILKEVVRQGTNEDAKVIALLTKNIDKANYLKEVRESSDTQDYRSLVTYLKKYRLLSDELELLTYQK